MGSTVVFIHGTGVRDVSGAITKIRQGLSDVVRWDQPRVYAIEWGRAVGADDLDITPALPPRHSPRSAAPRGVADNPATADEDDESALWELLMADPYAELRIMAASEGSGDSPTEAPDPTVAPLSDDIIKLVQGIDTGQDALSPSGIDADVLAAARDRLADDAVLVDAAEGGFDLSDLAPAIARALVADCLQQYLAPQAPPVVSSPSDVEAAEPLALYDADSRDAAVDAITGSIEPGVPRGVIGDFGKRIFAKIATRVAVDKRSNYMNPFSDFLRDVSRYLTHGAEIRKYLADQIRKVDDGKGLIIVAHSLGGIAAVDLLSDPAVMQSDKRLPVDLLVTVGSQAPYLYLLDSLHTLSPKSPGEPPPFEPWLNIYNPEDLLSFCAARVWPNSTHIRDEAIDSGVPFPMSHSAYWTQKRLYELIRESLPL
jgi:hypothetical protein